MRRFRPFFLGRGLALFIQNAVVLAGLLLSLGCTEGDPEFADLGAALQAPSNFNSPDGTYTIENLTESVSVEADCDPRTQAFYVSIEGTSNWVDPQSLFAMTSSPTCVDQRLEWVVEEAGTRLGFTEGIAGSKRVLIKGYSDSGGESESTAITISYDPQKAEVLLQAVAGNYTNQSPFTVQAEFSKAVTGFSLTGISSTGATVSNLVQVDAQTYTFELTPSAEGTVQVQVNAAAATDEQGLASEASDTLRIEYDTTAPSATFSSTASGTMGVSQTASLTLAFSEPITGLTSADLVVTNGTLNGLEGSGDTYTFRVTPNASGAVQVDLAAGAITDRASNANTASADWSIVADGDSPTAALSTAESSPTNQSSIAINISLSEAADTLTAADFQVANATVVTVAGSGTAWTAQLNPISDGAVAVKLKANAFEDDYSNGNTESNELTWLYDGTAPSVSLASVSADSVNSAFTVTMTFSEDVSGFAIGDISVANGTASSFSGSGDEYQVVITPTAEGPVTVDINAGVATDGTANPNTAATQLSRTYDVSGPVLSWLTTPDDPTSSASMTISLSFNEEPIGLSLASFTTTNLTLNSLNGGPTNYTVEVTANGAGNSSIMLSAAAVSDELGNPGAASSSLSWTYDASQPTPVLSSAAPDDTNAPFTVNIDFDESVSGFSIGDIVATNATLSTFSGTADSYTVLVTPTSQGTVSIDVPAAVAQDASGNANVAATTLSRIYDSIAPTLTLTSASSSVVNGPFTVDIVFTENVDDFDSSDLTVTNATIDSFSGSGSTFTAVLNPTDTPITLAVAANVAEDGAGNGNAAASPLSRDFDDERPTLTWDTTPDAVSDASSLTLNFHFNESVSGLDLAHFNASNATLSDLTGGPTNYSVIATPITDGPIDIFLMDSQFTDDAGNPNLVSATLSWLHDTQDPVPTLAYVGPDPTNLPNNIAVALDFSETVYNVDATDIQVTNGSVDSVAGSGSSYTIYISPAADGTVTVNVPVGDITDSGGRPNTASNTLSFTSDQTFQGVTLTSPDPTPSPTLNITVDVSFAEPLMDEIDPSHFAIVGGTLNAILTVTAGQDYQLDLTGDGSSSIDVNLLANSVRDLAANYNASEIYSHLIDTTGPSLTFSATPNDPSDSLVARFEFSASDTNGISQYECRIDTDAFAPCTSPFDQTVAADGSYTFEVRATDGAGNDSVQSFTWTVSTSGIVVGPTYPALSGWNDYVATDDPNTWPITPWLQSGNPCPSPSTRPHREACHHAGELKKLEIADLSSCDGVTATDSLDVFEWICVDDSLPVTIYSTRLKEGKGLSDLIDFNTLSFRSFNLTVTKNSETVIEAPVSTWSNPIMDAPGGTATLVNLASQGVIYVVRTNLVHPGYKFTSSNITLVIQPGKTLSLKVSGVADYQCAHYAGTARCLINVSGYSHAWIEGQFAGAGANATDRSIGLLIDHAHFSRFNNVTISDLTSKGFQSYVLKNSVISNLRVDNVLLDGDSVGIDLRESHGNDIADLHVSNCHDGIRLRDGSSWNAIAGVMVHDVADGGLEVVDGANTNTISEIDAHNVGGKAVYLRQSSAYTGETELTKNILKNIRVTNSGYGLVMGMVGGTPDAGEGSVQGNAIYNATFSNSSQVGMEIVDGYRNSFVKVTVANSASHGIYIRGANTTLGENTFSHVSVINSGSNGIWVDANTNNTFSQVLVANSAGDGVRVEGASDYTTVHTAMVSHSGQNAFFFGGGTAPSGDSSKVISRLYVRDYGLSRCASGSCATTDPGFGLGSAFVGATGMLKTTASALASDLGHYSQTFGIPKSILLPFPDPMYRGSASTSIEVWDWSLRSGSPLYNWNDTFVAGGACNAALSEVLSGTFYAHDSNPWLKTGDYFVNAVEVMDDRDETDELIGNENGLCEEGETCVHSPTVGAYQGHGGVNYGATCTASGGTAVYPYTHLNR